MTTGVHMTSLRYLLALLIVFNASILTSQEPTEPQLAPLPLPSGVWRSAALDSATLQSLTPKNIHQVTYYEDGSYAAVYKIGRIWYRLFYDKAGNMHCFVYVSRVYRKP